MQHAEVLECSWCGGEISKIYRSRNGEVFCSKNHRDQSTRALRRFLKQAEDLIDTRTLARVITELG